MMAYKEEMDMTTVRIILMGLGVLSSGLIVGMIIASSVHFIF
jgi:hypothetical protein